MKQGTIEPTADGYVLKFEQDLVSPIGQVWAAIVRPDRRAGWMLRGDLEPVVGGTVDLEDAGGGVTGTVLAIEEPHTLDLSWSSHDAVDSLVRFTLRPIDDGCRMVVTHTVTSGEHVARLAADWHCCLERLPTVLAGEQLLWEPGKWQLKHDSYRQRVVYASA